MKETNLVFTARTVNSQSTEYLSVDLLGLATEFEKYKEDELSEKMNIRITNTNPEKWVGVIRVEVEKVSKNPKFYMPGFMYNRNTGEMPNSGRKEFPRIREGECRRPESKDWMVRSDRLASPVSLIYDEGTVYGISASPYRKENGTFSGFCGFTCTLSEGQERKARAGYTLGYENAPWLFVQTATVREREPLSEEKCFVLEPGATAEFHVTVYEYRAVGETGIYQALTKVYEEFHESPRKIEGMSVNRAVSELAGAVSEAAWIPEDQMYSGFVYDRESGYEFNKIGSLSWTNGLAVAVPMLMSALRLRDEKMRGEALECIDSIVDNCMNPKSGLPYDAVSDGKWSIHGWWYDGMHTPGHSSYLCGQAVYYVLKAYSYEKKLHKTEHSKWLEFAAPILEKVNRTMNTEFEYPFVLSEENGAGLEYNSMGGCWCLAATAFYMNLTGDRKYLEDVLKSEQHYYDKFVSVAECYGGPLDTDKAVDSEGILAYIRAVRSLHEITGDDKLLQHLRDAIYYECSFKLCYNPPIQVPPLSEIGWSGCGGSITSTANPHVHPMSGTVVDELIYYVKKTDDTYVRMRLEDTVAWGLQTFNTYDGEYGYGKTGWMSERFCFCQGLLTEKYPDGSPASTWFALMPWASCSILEGLTGDCWPDTTGEKL